MKRNLSALLALLWILLLPAGCSPPASGLPQGEHSGGQGLSVVCTLFPGYDFAGEIAGERVSRTLLLPPGSESHSFEPTPRDIITIQNCDLFLYVGGESETWVKGILDSMDTSGMVILSMMDLVEVVEQEIKEGMEHDHGHQHGHGDHGEEPEYDEHVWTSPVHAKQIVEALSDALCRLDEDNAPLFRQNTAAYLAELDELDASFRQVVGQGRRRTLVFGDRFPFRYLVEEYELDYYAAFPGCSAETEANAKTVAFLIDRVKAEKIPVVFHLELSNERMADTISESTGAKKRLLHSCHNVTKAELESGISYLELMRRNVEALREALS